MHRPSAVISCLVIVTMVIAATLQAGENKVEPVLRKVATTQTVAVTYLAGKGFRISGEDAKGAVDVLKGRLGLLPMLVDGKLNAVGVVTYEPVKGKKAAMWPNLQAVKDVKKQHIAAVLNVTFKCVLQKNVLQGFQLVTIAATKGVDSDDEVMPAGKETKSVEHKQIMFDLPKERDAKLWYGVMLVPVFDKDGNALKGFDATLVSTPRKAN